MKKEHYRQAIRDSLRAVPLENRRQWTETDLFGWWVKASRDSTLVWERSPGDPWQHVPGFCVGLIGKDASV